MLESGDEFSCRAERAKVGAFVAVGIPRTDKLKGCRPVHVLEAGRKIYRFVTAGVTGIIFFTRNRKFRIYKGLLDCDVYTAHGIYRLDEAGKVY